MLLVNALNLGVDGGLMIGHGKAAEFFTLILPHGMLELSAVFLAAAAGLRMGWASSILARAAASRRWPRRAGQRSRSSSG